MKKKLAAVIMSACVGAALLAGCGASGSAESTEKAETAAADTAETADTAESADAAESEASGASYKIGIVQYMDHASLNQITEHLEKELDAKADELNVSFDYEDYFINGQGDSTIITQGLAQLKDDGVDAVVCVATPTALTAQSTFEGTGTPIIFSAVTDPVGAGLVSSMDEPGGNITGTSDALNTEAIMNLIFAQNPDADKIGLLYSTSEDSSTQAIADAKAFLDAKGVEYVEKTGTNTTEVSQAADALIAAGVDAIFTPTDNTVMSAELSIYDKLADAGIPHYTGADSFALNGAFLGFGINYADLGSETADMVANILVNGQDPASYAVVTLGNGIATINTETAERLGVDLKATEEAFKPYCSEIVETVTAENFED